MTALRMNIDALHARSLGVPHLTEHVEQTKRVGEEFIRASTSSSASSGPHGPHRSIISASATRFASGVSEWSRRFGVTAEFAVSGNDDVRLPQDVETNLYRLVQEALHNIAKHAEARAALTGGHLEIDSTPGVGTSIFVRIPDRGRAE